MRLPEKDRKNSRVAGLRCHMHDQYTGCSPDFPCFPAADERSYGVAELPQRPVLQCNKGRLKYSRFGGNGERGALLQALRIRYGFGPGRIDQVIAEHRALVNAIARKGERPHR